MIKKVIQDAINEQIVRELYSSNLYLSMAAYYRLINLNGFANWMRVQVQEEMFHAMKFFDYMLERGGEAMIGVIDAPPTKWDSPLDVFIAAQKHEESVTEHINKLATLAMKENDYATNILLQWFITEQVEEEATVTEIVERMRLAGDSKSSLFMLDSELKTRVFVPPVAAGNQA
ncbi:MAG: ferritin [Bacteroidetes bacterium]|nr:MAG: ferritin [Bacteroidota bacterium]